MDTAVVARLQAPNGVNLARVASETLAMVLEAIKDETVLYLTHSMCLAGACTWFGSQHQQPRQPSEKDSPARRVGLENRPFSDFFCTAPLCQHRLTDFCTPIQLSLSPLVPFSMMAELDHPWPEIFHCHGRRKKSSKYRTVYASLTSQPAVGRSTLPFASISPSIPGLVS